MEAKDASVGFDFCGTYDEVSFWKTISYTLDDGRKVEIDFDESAKGTLVTQTFEPDKENPAEMQLQGWQAILNNFKIHTENL